MKYFITLSFIVLQFVFFAQTPEGVNYQAVIRDNSGNPLENSEVGIKIALYQGTVSGTIVFVFSCFIKNVFNKYYDY